MIMIMFKSKLKSKLLVIGYNQRGEINVANLWRHIQYVSHVKRAF